MQEISLSTAKVAVHLCQMHFQLVLSINVYQVVLILKKTVLQQLYFSFIVLNLYFRVYDQRQAVPCYLTCILNNALKCVGHGGGKSLSLCIAPPTRFPSALD